MSFAEQRIAEAVEIAAESGTVDGAHHKMWVIDQMVRKLLGPDGYEAFVAKNSWDEGIAP